MPSSITGKRQPSADSSNEPWYCIASRRELFTGSAAGCMRAHSSICGTTDSGAYSRLSFWAPVILPTPSIEQRCSTIGVIARSNAALKISSLLLK